MAEGACGDHAHPHHELAHSSLPAPIPWLGQVGRVRALDASQAPAPVPRRLPVLTAPHRASTDQAPTTPVEQQPTNSAPLGATTDIRRANASVLESATQRLKWRPKKKKRPGSGIPARKVIRVLVWVRRFAQATFLGLFCYLLAQTAFRGTFTANAEEPVRLPLPVEGFLLADPFVAAMTLLSTHTIYRGLAWALVIVALTIVFGRVFCGWICPFGTLHHFFGWLFPS